MTWKLEIVYAIFGKKYFTEDGAKEPNELEREFLRLHTIGMSHFYCVLVTDLEGPLTQWQTHLLDQAKAEGNILDYCARQVISP